MFFFEHDGLRFHYRESGSGLPFILLHGLGADINQPFELFRPPPGIRLLSFDCRAHGETRPLGDVDKICIEQFAEDLDVFLEHMDIDRAIIGGISMGAAVALHFAIEYPDSVCGLVLSRPAWLDCSRQDKLSVFSTLADYIRKYGAWEGAQRYQQTDAYQSILKVSPDNANSLLSQFAHPRAEETVAKLERIPAYIPAHSREQWSRIPFPTLILANRHDAIHPFEFGEVLAAHIPHAELQEITPKSMGKEQHIREFQTSVANFLHKNYSSK